MTFRLFIYYCALCGGWAALLGWAVGRNMTDQNTSALVRAGITGLCLGLFISLALSMVDSMWSLSSFGQMVQAALRITVAVMVGSIGGMMGGVIGQILYDTFKNNPAFLVVGWTLTGLLIGLSVGVFDVLQRLMMHEDLGGAIRKVGNGMIGGTMGGVLGGILTVVLHKVLNASFGHKLDLWTPSATGFVALGACIGLLIGLAQIILKEAWVRVESGRRAGKELIISKKEMSIGRAEACDLGIFGDNAIEKMHARIIRMRDGFLLTDCDTPGGTYLNGRRINGPAPLRSGDAIRVGNCVIRFNERAKRG